MTTIFLVNLMVAIMTTAYESVREQSVLNRKFRKVAPAWHASRGLASPSRATRRSSLITHRRTDH